MGEEGIYRFPGGFGWPLEEGGGWYKPVLTRGVSVGWEVGINEIKKMG
jgi:hypothetical protein